MENSFTGDARASVAVANVVALGRNPKLGRQSAKSDGCAAVGALFLDGGVIVRHGDSA